MFPCRFKSCPVTLLFRSFYDKRLAEGYIVQGHGIGFMPLFVLSILVSLIYAVYSVLFLGSLSPEIVTQNIQSLPTIEIKNGQIVQPENFFQRFQLANGLNLTLDTTPTAPELVKDPSPNEIYISKKGIQFVKGHKIELMPLNKFLGTQDITITQDNISDFIGKVSDEMMVVLPSFVFLIAVPLLFLKYVILVYLLALLSYAATVFSKLSVPFESRMRLATLACIPVFVFNLFFGALFGLFYMGPILGVIVTLLYLFFYLGQMPDEVKDAA